MNMILVLRIGFNNFVYNVKHEFRVPLETERVLSIQIPSGN